MIVFSLWRVILVEFESLTNVEVRALTCHNVMAANKNKEIFDAIYCYFPITFRPPPDDPYKITSEDLKQRLRDCLSSTHYFGKHIFPALIEKLDSSILNVKVIHQAHDSILTI